MPAHAIDDDGIMVAVRIREKLRGALKPRLEQVAALRDLALELVGFKAGEDGVRQAVRADGVVTNSQPRTSRRCVTCCERRTDARN